MTPTHNLRKALEDMNSRLRDCGGEYNNGFDNGIREAIRILRAALDTYTGDDAAIERAYREGFLAGAQERGDPTGDAEAWAREMWLRSESRAALHSPQDAEG